MAATGLGCAGLGGPGRICANCYTLPITWTAKASGSVAAEWASTDPTTGLPKITTNSAGEFCVTMPKNPLTAAQASAYSVATWLLVTPAGGGAIAKLPVVAPLSASKQTCSKDDCTQLGTFALPGVGVPACVADAAVCEDSNPCTSDSCDAATGCKNVVVADATPCSDGDPCTNADVCKGGACKGGAALDCDDSNACTSDSCEAGVGCSNVVQVAATCSDGDACTQGDACSAAGTCVGKAVVCSDNNECTDDSCDKASGCLATHNTAACDDGDACTVGDACAAGACTGKAKDCNDGNDGNGCTNDACVAGVCDHTAVPDGSGCNDGNACTSGTNCSAAACVVAAAKLEAFLYYHQPKNFSDHGRIYYPIALDAGPADALVLAAGGEEDNGVFATGAQRLVAVRSPLGDTLAGSEVLWTEDKCSGAVRGRPLAVEALDGAGGYGAVALGRAVRQDAVGACAGKPQPDKAWVWSVNIAIAGVKGASKSEATVAELVPFSASEQAALHTFVPLGMVAAQFIPGGAVEYGIVSIVGGDLDGQGGDGSGIRFTVAYDDAGTWKTKHLVLPGVSAELTDEAEVRAVDLDGDGDLDVVVSASPRKPDDTDLRAFALRNDGDGVFVATLIHPSKGATAFARDINKDGKVDLVTFGGDLAAGLVGDVRLNDGGKDWYTKPGQSLQLGKEQGLVGVQDGDGDGVADYFVETALKSNDALTRLVMLAGSWKAGKLEIAGNGLVVGPSPQEMYVTMLTTPTLLAARNGQFLAYQVTAGPCNDGNACTLDQCDPAKGCSADTAPKTQSNFVCDDGDLCTTGDSCASGTCKGGASIACDDNSSCTKDSCDKATGCAHNALAEGTVCSDNVGCDTGGACKAGQCAGATPKDCDGDKPCTADACGAGGCQHDTQAMAGGWCDDGKPCTEQDSCDASGTGVCADKALAKDTPCSDGNDCIVDRACDAAAACVGGSNAAKDAPCNDSNPCTDESCDGSGKCVAANVGDGGPCDDGNPCTSEACKAGKCVATNLQAGSQCDDNNVCTSDDGCSDGSCVGKPVPDGQSCQDSYPCYDAPVCQQGGCMAINPVTDGVPCDDGSFCNVGEACQQGNCQGLGQQKDCDDSNECTQDACDEGAKACSNTAMAGAACNGGAGVCDDQGACK